MEAEIPFSASDIDFAMVGNKEFADLANFTCGVAELDDFFHLEAEPCSKFKYLSTYKCELKSSKEIIGLFTLANDVLALEVEDKLDFTDIDLKYDNIFQRQTSYPAINIGHLAVSTNWQSNGIGSLIVNFIAATFKTYRASGCQFITVDALNNHRTVSFYTDKLGFDFQTLYDINKPTRRMYLPIFL